MVGGKHELDNNTVAYKWNCQPNLFTNVMGPSSRFQLSKVEFYAPHLRCQSNFKNSLKMEYCPKRVKDWAEEDVWKRGDFGNNPPLIGYTKPNRFSKNQLAVSSVRHCKLSPISQYSISMNDSHATSVNGSEYSWQVHNRQLPSYTDGLGRICGAVDSDW